MADLFSALPYVVDLDKPVTKTVLYNLFVTTNKKAHRFIITLRRGGVDVPFTGSVVGTLINYSDMMTQEYPGRAEDGKVVFDWPASFYAKSGLFCVIITVDDGEVSNSVFAAEGSMILGETDTLYDPSHVVPSLAELLAQIEATRNAATAANNAANSANNAASSANDAARTANTATSNANAATTAATNAANTANTAASNANAAATAATNAAGAANQAAGRAETVASKSPYIGDNGNWYVFDVTAGEYVDSGLPSRGIPGQGAVSTVNSKQPDTTGNVQLSAGDVGARPDNWTPTAQDVGALAVDGTAVDASKLGGKIASYYGSKPSLLWENASPSSEYPPQSQNVNFAQGKTYLLVFGNTFFTRWGKSVIVHKQDEQLITFDITEVSVNDGASRYGKIMRRNLSIYGDRFEVSNCYAADSYGAAIATIANNNLIPLFVYEML